jgi:hypothetical protein
MLPQEGTCVWAPEKADEISYPRFGRRSGQDQVAVPPEDSPRQNGSRGSSDHAAGHLLERVSLPRLIDFESRSSSKEWATVPIRRDSRSRR